MTARARPEIRSEDVLCDFAAHRVIPAGSSTAFGMSDQLRLNLALNELAAEVLSEVWRVSVLDISVESMAGGRLKCAMPLLFNEPFRLTSCNWVSNVNIGETLRALWRITGSRL